MISENKTGRVSSEKEEQSVFSAASWTAANEADVDEEERLREVSFQHAAKRIFTFRKQAKKDALRDVGEVFLLHARC